MNALSQVLFMTFILALILGALALFIDRQKKVFNVMRKKLKFHGDPNESPGKGEANHLLRYTSGESTLDIESDANTRSQSFFENISTHSFGPTAKYVKDFGVYFQRNYKLPYLMKEDDIPKFTIPQSAS
eukprot:CAMPEP_0170557332 /NCGR_PEP_ID=MMETSP0211-20121228/24169_1 /TAXON_ID=311385 /ORGANISM="Pseudokeronopsis sp., Strain OXSARD2" /LENGTH=128 /DNA_ID=CAMNT_0010868251 /DNA_START=105 /DNA_END=491 /DNA_ORIENTATION=-